VPEKIRLFNLQDLNTSEKMIKDLLDRHRSKEVTLLSLAGSYLPENLEEIIESYPNVTGIALKDAEVCGRTYRESLPLIHKVQEIVKLNKARVNSDPTSVFGCPEQPAGQPNSVPNNTSDAINAPLLKRTGDEGPSSSPSSTQSLQRGGDGHGRPSGCGIS
jgi:hypothetical protein